MLQYNLAHSIKNIISHTFLQRVRQYVLYINVFALLAVSIWLFLFMKTYFLSLRADVAFVEENITLVSPTALNQEGFSAVYEKHQSKIESAEGDLLEGLKNPFLP